MKTAEAIEGITDAGEFELLATRVLRITDEDCRLLEHMGVNAAGKPVANPIDGFCRVPGTDPPRFVMAQFTTDRVETLERKWLFDHSAAPNAKKATAAHDGDLIKASRRAEPLRKDYPDAKFVLHLCTNRQPDDELLAKAIKRGHDLNIEVRFLTRSCLRDVLDVTSDGQWLRKEHLGIQAERLSLPLLRELSAKSIQRYEREFLVTPPHAFVSTSSARALKASLASSRSMHVVTGASGTGKSVSCYLVLKAYLAEGGVGLWIPGEIAARASSLEEAIDLTLRSLYPTIEPGSGATALRLQSPLQRLLLIVDDVNRGGSPAESLRKLLTWGHPSHDEKTDALAQSYAIVVPVWDFYWAPWAPQDQQLSSAGWLARIPINSMDEDEALRCLAASLGPRIQEFAEADQQLIVAALGHDPILIALYADSVAGRSELHPPALAHEVMGRFVQTAESEAAQSDGHLQEEYDLALAHLATRLVNQRDLYPRWEDVKQWLSADDAQAIRELAHLGKLCRLSGQGGENRFEFRHDRILEHFLVRVLQPMLSNLESNADVLADPFYASFVGRALASSQPSDELLEWVQQYAPLALISSLRFLPSLPNDIADRIAAAATYWLESASKDQRTPPVVLFEAYRLLEGMDAPHLLSITQSLPRHRLLARARLANGEAAAGVVEFSDTRWFAPAVTDRGLDAVLSRAIHRHKQGLIAECVEMLQRANLAEADRCNALVLAGFIADAALAAPIRTAWDLATDKSNALLPALWAGLRCSAADPSSVLDGMMAAWASLPDDGAGGGPSERASTAQELQSAVRRGIPEPVLRYLIAQAKANEAIRWPVTLMLECVDHPLVVTFLIEEAAEIERKIKGTGGLSLWLMTLMNQWDPTIEMIGRRLPPEAVQAIRSCWESKAADSQLRETAFKFWVRAVDDLDMLRSIPTDHPQFEIVLSRRARLGDLSTIPLIKPLVAVDQKWFQVIGKIWSDQFKQVLDDALLKLDKHTPTHHTGGTTNEHYMLAHLLRDIPGNEAQPFVVKHWDHLKFNRLFVQVALYIGSPECVALATKAIDGYPSEADPFKHLDYFFGFSATGLMDRVEYRHLEVLLPYLGMLSDHTLSAMANFCERHGYRDWGRVHLKPEFDRRRSQLPQVAKESREFIERLGRHHFPSDADLLQELDWIEQQGNHHYGDLHFWSEDFERRQDDRTRWRRILDEWFSRKPTIERFRLFANAVLERGTRRDIDLLYKHVISGDPNEIEQLRTNAKVGIMRRSLR